MIRYYKINNTHNSLTINQNNQFTEFLLSDIKEGFSEDEDNKAFNFIIKLDNNSNSSRYNSNSDLESINSNNTL